MKIVVLGLGYVGEPLLAGMLNETNHDLVGYDVSEEKIELLKGNSEYASGRLQFSSDPNSLENSEIFILCVPTPVDQDYNPDYRPLISAVDTVSPHLSGGALLVVESTVNPGTCEEMLIPRIATKRPELTLNQDYYVLHVPERISPGDDQWQVTNIPRNIGGSDLAAANKLKDLYAEFINAELRVVSSLKVAESSKIVENSFRDINIAFVNELAKSFDAMGVDLLETISAASTKPFGYMPFYPGPGVGGHCIPVDPYYLIKRAAKSGFDHRLLKEGRNINNSMPTYVVQKLTSMLNELQMSVSGTKMALLGLSYKGNVGDLRESPALVVKAQLEELGADLSMFDPYVKDLSNVEDIESALDGAVVAVLLTNHKQFLDLSSADFQQAKIKAVLDTRGVYDQANFADSGIAFSGIGR